MENIKNIFQDKYKKFDIPTPKAHFVLGSLLCSLLKDLSTTDCFSQWEKRGQIHFSEIPNLHTVSAFSHLGYYEYFYHKQKNISICFQSGRLHGYEGLKAQEIVKTVTGPCLAGTNCFILSNISGGLKKDLPVGSVIAITDHINFTGQSPLVGLSKKLKDNSYFINMENAYNIKLTDDIINIIKQKKLNVSKGIYVGVLGPQFETPAEVALFAKWEGDVVGMSTLFEVIALHYLKAKVSVCSLVSNPACGIGESVVINDLELKPYGIKLIQSFINFAENKL